MPRIPPIDAEAAPAAVRKLLELQPGHARVLGTIAHAETLRERKLEIVIMGSRNL